MPPLHLFEGYGIELEYIIVNTGTLDVLPLSDEVLRAAAGRYTNSFISGEAGWSNEFVLHVMELKNVSPSPDLKGLSGLFNGQVVQMNSLLASLGGRLMPSGMHPWMNPSTETRLWQRRYRHIYETYDRIFNCKKHGWANIQSAHVNISFRGDDEFAKLHSAVRLLLPLIPAIAASSPLVEGKVSGMMDTRLFHYSRNQRKIPSITGRIIPENVSSRREYEDRILGKMYEKIASFDRKGILRHEWLNSRGAIPRFERNALELRVLDIQECPRADLAVAGLIVMVVKALACQRWCSWEDQAAWKNAQLIPLFHECMHKAEQTPVRDRVYLKMFGFPGKKATSGEIWQHLLSDMPADRDLLDDELSRSMRFILETGPLSRRILKATGRCPSRKRLRSVYGQLCDCLAQGEMFRA